MPHHRSHYAMQFQALLGIFWWSSGASRQSIHTLQRCGLPSPTNPSIESWPPSLQNTSRTPSPLPDPLTLPLTTTSISVCRHFTNNAKTLCRRSSQVRLRSFTSCGMLILDHESPRITRTRPQRSRPPLRQRHPTLVEPVGEYPAPTLPPRHRNVGKMGPRIPRLQISPRPSARATQVCAPRLQDGAISLSRVYH
jgi:hypothetical protein